MLVCRGRFSKEISGADGAKFRIALVDGSPFGAGIGNALERRLCPEAVCVRLRSRETSSIAPSSRSYRRAFRSTSFLFRSKT
eukprot:2548928-Alexandrium_andersonii.AAC.1